MGAMPGAGGLGMLVAAVTAPAPPSPLCREEDGHWSKMGRRGERGVRHTLRIKVRRLISRLTCVENKAILLGRRRVRLVTATTSPQRDDLLLLASNALLRCKDIAFVAARLLDDDGVVIPPQTKLDDPRLTEPTLASVSQSHPPSVFTCEWSVSTKNVK